MHNIFPLRIAATPPSKLLHIERLFPPPLYPKQNETDQRYLSHLIRAGLAVTCNVSTRHELAPSGRRHICETAPQKGTRQLLSSTRTGLSFSNYKLVLVPF